ncbi:MAG: acetylornithine/succinylornithine family transaminase [Deltaproteobacteria bacterium]|nr:acetylornithine/succinylornithine family transaminase [Deltaproteobacteria bacterium]
MSNNAEIAALASHVLVSNYRQAPIALVRGQGAEVWDADGRRYLDLYAGIAVSTLGHAHPQLVRAIADQAAAILHTTNLVYNEPSVRLAERLVSYTRPSPEAAPLLSRAFFCNSGTEAIEACVKLSRRRAFLAGENKRTRFLAFHNAFHGRSMGALALTGTPKYWEGFGADVERATHVAYGDLDAVQVALDTKPGEYCAIVVEPVQGEGGVFPAPPGFLRELRSLADAHGALLIVDEVQTGIGRTGRWYGYQQHEGVVPDAIALAKGLGGGVPVGAMLVREQLNGVLTPGSHGSTFGGNPLATSAALAVLEVMEHEKLVQRASAMGEHLAARLRDVAARHPDIFEGERGLGLLRGMLMRPGVEARTMLVAARAKGVLLSVASERVLRFTPPLNIPVELLDEAIEAIDAAAASLTAPVSESTLPSR